MVHPAPSGAVSARASSRRGLQARRSGHAAEEAPVPDLPRVVPARPPGRGSAAGLLIGGLPDRAPTADAGLVALVQPGLLRGAAVEAAGGSGVAAAGTAAAADARPPAARPTPLGRRARPVRGPRCGFSWGLRQSPAGSHARPEARPSVGFLMRIRRTPRGSPKRRDPGCARVGLAQRDRGAVVADGPRISCPCGRRADSPRDRHRGLSLTAWDHVAVPVARCAGPPTHLPRDRGPAAHSGNSA